MKIMSKIDSIDICYIEPMQKNRAIKVKKVVKIDDYTIIFEKENGQLVTNTKKYAGRMALIPSGSFYELELIKALVALGRVTKAQCEEHITFYKNKALERNKEKDLKYAKEYAEKHGYKVVKK